MEKFLMFKQVQARFKWLFRFSGTIILVRAVCACAARTIQYFV